MSAWLMSYACLFQSNASPISPLVIFLVVVFACRNSHGSLLCLTRQGRIVLHEKLLQSELHLLRTARQSSTLRLKESRLIQGLNHNHQTFNESQRFNYLLGIWNLPWLLSPIHLGHSCLTSTDSVIGKSTCSGSFHPTRTAARMVCAATAGFGPST